MTAEVSGWLSFITGRLLTRVIAMFVGLQVAALVAVVVSNLVPNEVIVNALREAVRDEAINASDLSHWHTGNIGDQYGECVMLSVGLGEGRTSAATGWFSRAVISPNLGPCSKLVPSLDAYSQVSPDVHTMRYWGKIRYWNGLSAVARPVVALVGVNGLRTLAMLALGVSIAVLYQVVSGAAGHWSAMLLLGPFVATGDLLGLVQVFHHPLMLAVGFAGITHLARCVARGRDWNKLSISAFVVGSVYSFVDLMNFVPGLWVMVVGVVAACTPTEMDTRLRCWHMLAAGIAWPCGYLSMWMGKWVWAAIASSWSSVADNIFGRIVFRINGETSYTSNDFAAGLKDNIGYWFDQPLSTVVIVLSGLAISVLSVVAVRRNIPRIMTAAVIVTTSLIVIPWYLVFNNHNEIHYWFEYRSLPIVFGVGLMAFRCGFVDRARA